MDIPYPPSPIGVSEDLSKASAKYKFHAWLAMMGLLLFVLIYISLTCWFCYSSYRFLSVLGETHDFIMYLIKGLGAGFLGLFMLKALFFVKHSEQSKDFEVTEADQPKLFSFLHRLADETKAPRPHRVFITPEVNACVFYDLSLLNFFLPSKKNLVIGLGLVNVLSLSELKAVLAHEFGHFAQSTMAVGRWVYVAQQVAVQLIYHRDFFDSFLSGMSRVDFRIAWIAWILRIVIWSIRSILDTTLDWVMLAHRALSREMEFQADLVAVKVSGSDALIHALFKLQAADMAWDRSKSLIDGQMKSGSKPEDLFCVQSRVLEHQRRILNDPEFGVHPAMPEEGRESHRIFTPDLAQPPQMWSTHPQNHYREANAKERYISADLDERSAWDIFENPDALRRKFCDFLLNDVKADKKNDTEVLKHVDEQYDKEFYNPRYRGAYLGRSIVEDAKTIDALYHPNMDEAYEFFPSLYPESLTDDLEKLRNLEKEQALLEELKEGNFEAHDRIIRFRGETIKRKELPAAIETVKAEATALKKTIRDHDLRCRSAHLAAARYYPGWENYLKSLLKTLHYAEHSLNNLIDAHRLLVNTYMVVIADGNISGSELTRLLGDTRDVHHALSQISRDKANFKISSSLKPHLDDKEWIEFCPKYNLSQPTTETLGEWLNAVEDYVAAFSEALSQLREGSLEELLIAENYIHHHIYNQTDPGEAPGLSIIGDQYKVLLPGQERKLQTKLNWWDSFQTATGFFPAFCRFVISLLIVSFSIYITIS
ncbi:MAG: M48 family metallopeptidase [Verrucomicrobiota bacterium]